MEFSWLLVIRCIEWSEWVSECMKGNWGRSGLSLVQYGEPACLPTPQNVKQEIKSFRRYLTYITVEQHLCSMDSVQ